ncbi:MAG: 4-hydroxy-3-methylbut-2-enyl diphosphate reductase [Burkholderiaceae bacterium]|jgi:4-hydroxy-3-methylbut-2-en-1-yl diphosphate reductase|nr:4-hydroxy-3-methylbut-2-enyl diphosphate reductase [Pseudomonadota bacterium]MDP4577040.1 4-hydroxy-3-methylbut-2-enyl diphosphate reductase [Burkholderiaceae bacterium]MDP4669233.1 4-hydroxy-3-methylbut-2-enyl diphosphate reductase [Burkholderiaceae bacterium]MDP4800503.1 4-hydroxy-3-methylbut-2-enyl diphosphate reductase [Burkholderiaceae bacterium]
MPPSHEVEIVLAEPRGFCAGVDRAIEIVERALEKFGAPIYVRHEIVHNDHVVADLRAKGAIFVEDLDEVPLGSRLIMSAHGVARKVRDHAAARDLDVFDATCPLVTKVHVEVRKLAAEGMEVVMIGHAGHPEVEGTMGQLDGGIYLVEDESQAGRLRVRTPDRLAYVTQTTLSMDDTDSVVRELRKHFPNIRGPKVSDICYATQNRQDAVKLMSGQVDVVLVVGSKTSSNTNRLREVAERHGVPAHLLNGAEELIPAWLEGKQRVGITAGASAPEALVQGLVLAVKALGATSVRRLPGAEETIRFPLPKGLS